MRFLIRYVVASCVTFGVPNISIAQTDCKPSEILKNDVSSYESTTLSWLSYVQSLSEFVERDEASAFGIQYQGVGMSFHDASNLASYFQSNTGLELSQAERISVLSSYLPENRLKAFVECLKRRVSNVSIETPSGAHSQQVFSGVIKWHPTYTIRADNGSVARKIRVIATNGKVLFGDEEEIEPQSEAGFAIERTDMSVPLYITVYIDNRSSEIISFPPRTTHNIVLSVLSIDTPLLRRSGHHGPEAYEHAPTCITPKNGGILLPSTFTVSKSGGGHEWDQRTAVTPTDRASNESVCASVSSRGVPATEDRYGHQVQGHLQVHEASLKEIQQ